MTDHDDLPPLPEWAVNLRPPPKIEEDFRLMLVGLEIARQQAAYYRDNSKNEERKEDDD